MKKRLFSIQYFIGIILFFVAACTSIATPETQIAVDTPQSVKEPPSTFTSVPVPTTTPEPQPCTITFDSNRDGNWEIYRMDPDGSDTINLTNNPEDDFNPAWSPDGSQIAFVSTRPNELSSRQAIYIMDANGDNVFQLTTDFYSDWPDWSHDGKQLTYTSNDDIHVIKADGSSQPINLTNSPEKDTRSTWSPDGSKIAWLSGNNGNWDVFVMNSDGSNIQKITDNGHVFDVRWTGDGRIFTGWGWKDQQELCHNCIVNADGSNIVDAGGKGEVERHFPFWTLDGNMVGVANVDLFTGDNEIYLVGSSFPDPQGLGAGFVNLTNNPADDRHPDWPANCAFNRETESPIGEEQVSTIPKEILIGYAGDNQWQQDRKNNFQKACDELGIRCIFGEITELIDQGVVAIIQNSNAVAVDGLFTSITAAKEKGIPVFILDAEINIDGVYSITIDHDLWAKTSLRWMFEKIGGKGQIGYFDLHPFNRYTDTINDLISQYPEISVVDKRDGKYDPMKIKPEFTLDFVNKFPDLKALWTSYDNTQAIWGLEENGIPYEKWPIVVCEPTLDGLLTWERVQKAYPKFDCIAPANPSGIAYNAVHAAYYLVTGAQINEAALAGQYGNSLYVDIPVVTNDNLQQWLEIMNKTNTHGVDQLMTPEEVMEKWFVD